MLFEFCEKTFNCNLCNATSNDGCNDGSMTISPSSKSITAVKYGWLQRF